MPQAKDRCSRLVARVSRANKDASAEKIRSGMAWKFERYVTDRSLYALQDEARNAKRGLWADPATIPP
jgi:endonuclease YncB( thermonuclease family)